MFKQTRLREIKAFVAIHSSLREKYSLYPFSSKRMDRAEIFYQADFFELDKEMVGGAIAKVGRAPSAWNAKYLYSYLYLLNFHKITNKKWRTTSLNINTKELAELDFDRDRGLLSALPVLKRRGMISYTLKRCLSGMDFDYKIIFHDLSLK